MAQSPAPIFKIPTESPQPARGRPSRAPKLTVAEPKAASRVARIETRAATRGDGEVIELDLGITVYPPKDKGGRWRAVWHEDGERQQSESVSEEKLAAKLEKVRQRLSAGAANMTKPGADLIAWYLDPDRLPVADRWSRKHADTQRRLCQRYASPAIGVVTCQDITVSHTQKIVNAAPTASEGDRVHRMLSAMVSAGLKGGYLVHPMLAGVHWQAGDHCPIAANDLDPATTAATPTASSPASACRRPRSFRGSGTGQGDREGTGCGQPEWAKMSSAGGRPSWQKMASVENFHRSARALPATRRRAGHITRNCDTAGHSLTSRLAASMTTRKRPVGEREPRNRSE